MMIMKPGVLKATSNDDGDSSTGRDVRSVSVDNIGAGAATGHQLDE